MLLMCVKDPLVKKEALNLLGFLAKRAVSDPEINQEVRHLFSQQARHPEFILELTLFAKTAVAMPDISQTLVELFKHGFFQKRV